jgi:hypothetical protein
MEIPVVPACNDGVCFQSFSRVDSYQC